MTAQSIQLWRLYHIPGDGHFLGPVSDCSSYKICLSYAKVKLLVQLLPIVPSLVPWETSASTLFLPPLEVL